MCIKGSCRNVAPFSFVQTRNKVRELLCAWNKRSRFAE